jgi:acetaldehyde dehydrogenase (acetylating)
MSDQDLQSIQKARDLVEAAHRAQAMLARFDQAKIDGICEAMAQAAQADSLRLATLAREESGYGNAPDKNIKNLFAAVNIHNYFKGLRTVGVVRESASVIEIAAPRGVVAAIVPSTNPTSTAIFKILISIKSRNAVVLSPHPSATQCVLETAGVMRAAAMAAGLPGEAIGCLDSTTVEGTEALMKHQLTAVILATGGIGLVRAAYSSGKPAFGVGPGNVPVLVERSADVAKAAADILAGTCFDFGTICASEQSVVVEAPLNQDLRQQFISQGAVFLNPQQIDALSKIVVTSQRTLNPKVVGRPATKIAEMAGISVPPQTRCLIAEVGGVGRDYPLSLEKLSPILTWYVASDLEQGSRLCDEILHYGGMGHTAGIHSRNREAVLQYGLLMPAARVVVNSPTTHGAIGFSTDLAPSMTLGCGSWGGNVTSDNISPLHLMDIKRVAYEVRPVTVPANYSASASVAATPVPSKPVIERAAIAALVQQFLSARKPQTEETGKAKAENAQQQATVQSVPPAVKPAASVNNHQPVDFVCEDDVRRALQAGQKIYINAKTILTPSARDLGQTHEIFAKI